MAQSQNGWSVLPTSSSLDNSTIPGTDVKVAPGVRSGDVARVLHYVGEQFNKRVEPLTSGWCWGYANRNVIGGSDISNHASGTAIDLNAPKHPLAKAGTFKQSQVDTIHDILAECSGVIRWGGDYEGRKDEMHFEINANEDLVAVAVAHLNGETPPPISMPLPSPAPALHYETVRAGSSYNVRSASNANGTILGQVQGGQVYDTVVQGNGWRQITFKGHTGYVSGDAFGSAPVKRMSQLKVKPTTWNVRSKPNASATVTKVVSGGAIFDIIETSSDGWANIGGGWLSPKGYNKL